MADSDVRAASREVLLMDHEGAIDEALARAHALAAAHPESAIAHRLVGDLRYAASIHFAGSGVDSEEFRKMVSDLHLRVARDALLTTRRLAPDCVDVAAALGDVFCASKMYDLAEAEFRRAERIPCPVDPAENNAAYGMYREEEETTAAERVEEARGRARRSYALMTVEKLIPLAVERVLDTAMKCGAAEGRKQGKRVADSFPNLGRAQYLNAYMDLEFVRGLDASIDRRAFLRRTLTIAERAAQAFPNSLVIASFYAKLLFILGEYDAAERECRRALRLKEPDDPQKDCVPLGSVRGENFGARLVSMAAEFHELLNRILMLASDCWDSMSSERQEGYMSVRFDVLQDEYNMVDSSSGFTLSDVLSFVNEKESRWFWVCPICDGKKFFEAGLLLSHMCSKHPRAVLPRLQSVLDPMISEKAWEGDDYLDRVSLSKDSDQKYVVTFPKRSDLFKWLFFSPSSGVVAKPILNIRETKRQKGNKLLESIKEKMKTLPSDKSTTEFAETLPAINDLWRVFLRSTVMDYRAFILILARSFLWKELKKCMTEDHKAAAKLIRTADIDEIFTKEENTDEAPKIVESHEESEVHAAESSETTVNDTELSGPPISEVHAAESSETTVNDTELSGPPISEVHAAESSETTVNDTELSGPPINVTESGDDLDTKMKNLQIDPNSESTIATSEASSSDPNGQQV